MTLPKDVRDLNKRIMRENGGHVPGTYGAYLAQRDDWESPSDLFATYNASYDFTLDPCANFSNAVVAWYFDREQDGLSMRWHDVHGKPACVWMHAPHSEPWMWARKAVIESKRGATVVALLPVRTEAGWWHDFVLSAARDVRYLRGTPAFRLHRMPMIEVIGGRPIASGAFAIVTYEPRRK